MRQSKYLKQLEPFVSVPLFTAEDAEKKNVPRHALAYLVKRGVLERIYPGAFRFSQYEPEVEFQWENLALVAVSIPEGVICLISALCYYDLTDQIMRERSGLLYRTPPIPPSDQTLESLECVI
jgi:predicted transcriptional regulator of viral defense system